MYFKGSLSSLHKLFGYFAKLSRQLGKIGLLANATVIRQFLFIYIVEAFLSNENYYHNLCVLTSAGMPPDKGWNNGRGEKLENNNKKSCVSDRQEFVGISPNYSLSLKLCDIQKGFLGK